MALVTPPNDNLPTDSMKWGRWVTSGITDNDRRLDNLEATISNLNSTLNSAIASLSAALRDLS